MRFDNIISAIFFEGVKIVLHIPVSMAELAEAIEEKKKEKNSKPPKIEKIEKIYQKWVKSFGYGILDHAIKFVIKLIRQVIW